LATGQVIGTSESDPTDGSYIVVVPLGKMYGYFVMEDGYYPTSSNIDLRSMKTSTSITNDIMLTGIQDMISQGIPVPINNLFFDFGKSTLLSYSIPELERVAKIIKSSNSKVEISGHTDIVGDPKKNQILSEQRAEAVKQFLLQAGCDAGMLTTKGYGSTKPVATNNTEEGRAKNRRVELRFIK
jgi:outer membrane protein OmpA-like peptidoglycan-associated protein